MIADITYRCTSAGNQQCKHFQHRALLESMKNHWQCARNLADDIRERPKVNKPIQLIFPGDESISFYCKITGGSFRTDTYKKLRAIKIKRFGIL